MMKNRYHDFNTYLQNLYGERVHKISIDAGLNCPNRDGTLSMEGCIYCNPKGSGTGNFQKGLSIKEQIENGIKAIYKRYKAKKFIAYFQSFSNTYGPINQLERIYEEALALDEIVGLSVGTRPDCINEPTLSLLEGHAANNLVWVEYGLQSAHDKTLTLINRGHDVACFKAAVKRTQNRGINICAHVILGLPGETKQDMLETAGTIADLKIDGVKLHLLYVIKNTAIEKLYRSGEFKCLLLDEYIDIVCDFLELLPEHMVIQRLTSDPHPRELVAPTWSLQKNDVLAGIRDMLEKRDSRQGKFYNVVPNVNNG